MTQKTPAEIEKLLDRINMKIGITREEDDWLKIELKELLKQGIELGRKENTRLTIEDVEKAYQEGREQGWKDNEQQLSNQKKEIIEKIKPTIEVWANKCLNSQKIPFYNKEELEKLGKELIKKIEGKK